MPVYNYVAMSEKGRKIRGDVLAANEMDLEDRLKVIGLDLISCKARKHRKNARLGSMGMEDLIVFCIHLEQLERAGVPILDALADLRDTADSQNVKQIMADIYESVKGGSMLSAALAKHPKIFNTVFVSLVKAGETTGNLHEVFHHLSKHLKWVNSIHRRIKKAIYYPIFLLFLMSCIIALMMLFVIPKLSSFLTAQNFALPFYTKALIATSHFFVDYWYIVFSAPVVIYLLLKGLRAVSPNFVYNLDQLILLIPFIGPTIRKIELARFCHFFAVMYRSGIGILDCLEVSSSIINNRVIYESASVLKKSVSEGNSLTYSLRVSHQFPNLVIRMFKVGEESGNLDTTLENINFFYEREVEDSVNNLLGTIQPALTIVMGGIMAWVSLSVFGPLYSSFSKMNF